MKQCLTIALKSDKDDENHGPRGCRKAAHNRYSGDTKDCTTNDWLGVNNSKGSYLLIDGSSDL
jgi:hypothetical protein